MLFFGSGQSKTEQEHIFARSQQHIANQVKHLHFLFSMFSVFIFCFPDCLFLHQQKIALEIGGFNFPGVEKASTHDETATKVLCLTEVILHPITYCICYPKILDVILQICLLIFFPFW